MAKSAIFTDAELEALQSRRKGSKADPTGIFHARVKPKILEIIGWFKERNELKKLVEKRSKK